LFKRERERERERESRAAKIFSYENLLECYYECRKHKRFTINALKFEEHFESELLKLRDELVGRTYRPGKSICFVVKKPKLREIFAADFRDRVVHHVLVNYLEPIWEKKFIEQSYACRKGKGTHLAIHDLRRYIAKVTQGYSQKAYYLQVDIQSFFVSLDKEILLSIVKRHTRNPAVIWLAETIIRHEPQRNFKTKGQLSLFDLIPDHKTLFKAPQGKGLPIGNLTSQFFANVYMNDVDQFIKHNLKVKYYLRYVDDLVLLSSDKTELIIWQKAINNFLSDKLNLHLHPQKTRLQEIGKGIDFLGYVVRPHYLLARKRVVQAFKQKLRWFNNELLAKDLQKEQIIKIAKKALRTVNSYFGHLKAADCYGLKEHLWKKHFGLLMKFYRPADKSLSYLKLR